MQAIVLSEFGPAENLELRDIPEPSPGPGEVKIRSAATSVNPIDWKIRRGGYRRAHVPNAPMVLGRDVAGEVSEVGPGVDSLRVGDRVMGLIEHGYAEYVVAKADQVAKVPEGLALEEAAALPLVVTTGVELIDEQTKPSSGETVLVTGALGGVGRSAVFAAKRRGARVIAGVRSRQKREAEKIGADAVVAIDDDREIAALPELDAIADTVNGETILKLLPHVKTGGVVGSVLEEPAGAKERGLEVHSFLAHADARLLEDVARAAQRGDFRIPIGRTLPLAKATEAHRAAEKGGAGKIVLTMPDAPS